MRGAEQLSIKRKRQIDPAALVNPNNAQHPTRPPDMLPKHAHEVPTSN